jgi:hypothetical protein
MVDQAVWVTVTVSIVPLNANADVAVHVEARANPKRARILMIAVKEGSVDRRNSPRRADLSSKLYPSHCNFASEGSEILVMSRSISP